MESILVNGKKYRRVEIECEAPPCTRTCGQKEYEDADNKPERRPCKQFALDQDQLFDLYWNEGLSLNQIADESEYHFGARCSTMKVQRFMVKYGIPRRNQKRLRPVFKSIW